MDENAWHERFLIQAAWTKQLRGFLYQQIGLTKESRVLEVGCGTGVITSELKNYSSQPTLGIDIDFNRVHKASALYELPWFSCADVYHLPFASQSLDFVVSHFLFLWLKDPVLALKEMLRVLKPGGTVIALAEPDHLARIDYPKELWKLAELQTQALIKQGANPMMGRMLSEVFSQAGIGKIQFGVSGFQTSPTTIPSWFDSEWKTLQDDLAALTTQEELDQFFTLEKSSRLNGSRVLWVPTFYVFGMRVY